MEHTCTGMFPPEACHAGTKLMNIKHVTGMSVVTNIFSAALNLFLNYFNLFP